MIKTVIFDVDGTLIDSKEAHVQAWKQAFIELGYNIPIESIQKQFGRRKKETIEKFLPKEKCLTDGQKIIERKRRHFWQNFKSVEVFPGTYEIINYLKSKNIKIALATSAKRDELELYFQLLKIKDLVDTVISADEVQKSKPDPQAILLILNKLNLSPREALLIGDSIHDIEAGKNAGVLTVGVLTGYTSREQLLKSGANYIYKDIESLFKEIDKVL